MEKGQRPFLELLAPVDLFLLGAGFNVDADCGYPPLASKGEFLRRPPGSIFIIASFDYARCAYRTLFEVDFGKLMGGFVDRPDANAKFSSDLRPGRLEARHPCPVLSHLPML